MTIHITWQGVFMAIGMVTVAAFVVGLGLFFWYLLRWGK